MKSQPPTSQNVFLADVCNFFNGIIQENGYADSQKKRVLMNYRYEFDEYGETLSEFTLVDIKAVLTTLVSGTVHTLGDKIAEQLIKQLEDRLEVSDFLSIVRDPKFSHLYYKLV